MSEMTKRDTIEMMQRCVEEITALQQQVAALAPKAHAYDTVSQILAMMPQPSRGYGEDIVWRLRKQIEELQPKPSTENAAPSLPDDVRALVIAARKVAFEDTSPEAIRALDQASERFADRVDWEDAQ